MKQTATEIIELDRKDPKIIERSEIRSAVVSASEIINYLEGDRYLDMREAADLLGLSERNLKGRLSEIPHFRMGRRLMFRKSELHDWIERYREIGTKVDLDELGRFARKKLQLQPRKKV